MNFREELQKLYDQFGKLTPDLVVNEARNPDSDLHEYFVWDDAEAAELHRLEQARALIRRVKITYVDKAHDKQEVRAFVSVPSGNGQVYRHVDDVAGDPFQKKLILSQMKREWQTLLTRWGRYEEFWDLVQAGLEESGDNL